MAENPVPVCAAADVPLNGVISREVGDELVAIYNIGGVFYATEARCTHGLADLADGTIEGDVIECSFHFGAFHVPSGKAMQPSRVGIIWRTTPPPPSGIWKVWNFSVFGSKRTRLLGRVFDSIYQMTSL